MVYLSIYFCLQSLSSVFYSCPCTDLLPPWLDVFLDILLFLKQFPLLFISSNLTLMYMSALSSSILFRRYWAYFSLNLETFWKSYLHIIFVSQLPSHLLLGRQLLNCGPLLDIVPQVTEAFLSFSLSVAISIASIDQSSSYLIFSSMSKLLLSLPSNFWTHTLFVVLKFTFRSLLLCLYL